MDRRLFLLAVATVPLAAVSFRSVSRVLSDSEAEQWVMARLGETTHVNVTRRWNSPVITLKLFRMARLDGTYPRMVAGTAVRQERTAGWRLDQLSNLVQSTRQYEEDVRQRGIWPELRWNGYEGEEIVTPAQPFTTIEFGWGA